MAEQSSIQEAAFGVPQEHSKNPDWQLADTKHYVDLGNGLGMWSRHQAMIRKDGIAVEWIGIGRESQRTFLYKGHGIIAKIDASRYDSEGRNLENEWSVDFVCVVQSLRPEYEALAINMSIMADIVNAFRQVLPVWPLNDEERQKLAMKVNFVSYVDDILAHPENYSTYISERYKQIYVVRH